MAALLAGCASHRHVTLANETSTGGVAVRESAPAALSPTASDDDARLVGYFPDTPLVTQDGRQVHFYSDLVRDKRVLIQFMYSQCGET